MSLALLAGVVVAVAAPPNPAETVVCAWNAMLSGDAAATAAVGSALRRHGIQDTPGVGCSPLRVAIARAPSGLGLELAGPRGDVAQRVVASPDTAALLIESWLRTDIAAPLLAAHALDDTQPGAAAAAAAAAPPLAAAGAAAPAFAPPSLAAGGDGAPGLVQAAAPAGPEPASRVAFAIAGEAALARDGSRGGGAALGACARVGGACVGLTARLLRVWPVSPNPEVERALDRINGYGVDALVGAELAVRLGRVTLRPGAGVGAGWIGTRGMVVEHSADFDAFTPRAEARLALDVPLGRAFALELSLAGGLGAGATMDRVAMTRDRPVFVSALGPTLHAGLGVRFGGGGP